MNGGNLEVILRSAKSTASHPPYLPVVADLVDLRLPETRSVH